MTEYNKIEDGAEYIQDEVIGWIEINFKRSPKVGETDCDVCNLGEGKHCQNCPYHGLLPG